MKILVTIPVYNEELVLKENVLRVADFLNNNISDDWQVVIADNASTDKTEKIGKDLEKTGLPGQIIYSYIPLKGKGLAIKKSWMGFSADIYAFMDVDLSADLGYFSKLVEGIKDGNDVVIGSRFCKGSKTDRQIFGRIISKVLNFMLKYLLGFEISDSQCGFKATKKEVVEKILPLVFDNGWFFDAEFLFLAKKNGYSIKEIPIRWTETINKKRKSKINKFTVSIIFLKGIFRLMTSQKE